MCRSCDLHIDGVWRNLLKNKEYDTPDDAKGVRFSINSIEADRLKISPQNIYINKKAFSETLHYLKKNRHDRSNKIEIRSSDDPAMAGPLCTTARDHNGNIRCINYILPILFKNNIVGIDGNRPNKTWIISCGEADA